MDGYLIETLHKQAMLNQGNKTKRYLFIYLFIYLFSNSCTEKKGTENVFLKKNIAKMTKEGYWKIYHLTNDSLLHWLEKKCNAYPSHNELKYTLDSLLCFNTNNDRFISCIHCAFQGSTPMDDLQFILGEKINNQWYFFSGSTSVVLPRKFYQKSETTPLSYEQLHQIALKEVYGGYLTKDGEINEAWFISQFEGGGWGKYPETLEDVKKLTRTDYEKRHLDKVRNNWYGVKKDGVKQLQNKNEVLP